MKSTSTINHFLSLRIIFWIDETCWGYWILDFIVFEKYDLILTSKNLSIVISKTRTCIFDEFLNFYVQQFHLWHRSGLIFNSTYELIDFHLKIFWNGTEKMMHITISSKDGMRSSSSLYWLSVSPNPSKRSKQVSRASISFRPL